MIDWFKIILFVILTILLIYALWIIIIGGYNRYTWFNSGLNKRIMFKRGHYRIIKRNRTNTDYPFESSTCYIIQFKDVFGCWCDYWRKTSTETDEIIYNLISYSRSFDNYRDANIYLYNMKPKRIKQTDEVL